MGRGLWVIFWTTVPVPVVHFNVGVFDISSNSYTFNLYQHHFSANMSGILECDFILRDNEMRYSYVQVALTIALSKGTEDREYRPLESIRDNYPKYVATADSLLQKRNGIEHINLVDFMRNGKNF